MAAQPPRRWSGRGDFRAIQRIIAIAEACDPDCRANFLVKHIGMQNRQTGRPHNFIAIKGSGTASFSLELKLAPDNRKREQLRQRGWFVAPYHQIEGYRVHLPAELTDDDIEFLRPFIRQAHRDWRRSSE